MVKCCCCHFVCSYKYCIYFAWFTLKCFHGEWKYFVCVFSVRDECLVWLYCSYNQRLCLYLMKRSYLHRSLHHFCCLCKMVNVSIQKSCQMLNIFCEVFTCYKQVSCASVAVHCGNLYMVKNPEYSLHSSTLCMASLVYQIFFTIWCNREMHNLC